MRVKSSRKSDWLNMATMGPMITALGDMVFIRAQIRPALQKTPFEVHLKLVETRMIIPMAVSTLELKGIRRLCKKLPNTISDAAQMVPMMEAFIHFSLISIRLLIEDANFLGAVLKQVVSCAIFAHNGEKSLGVVHPRCANDIHLVAEQDIGN